MGIAGCRDSCDATGTPASGKTRPLPDFFVSVEDFRPCLPILEDQRFQRYRVRIGRDNDGHASIEIHKDDRIVLAGKGFWFRVGSLPNSNKPPIPLGTDITGDRRPNLVLGQWTGGVHGLFRFHVFELGEEPVFLQTLEAGHGDLSGFENLDDDPSLEISFHDWTFAYWHASFAQSPAPTIILDWDGREWILSEELMRRPAPVAAKLTHCAREIRDLPGWKRDPQTAAFPPPQLWAGMLDLIYSGNLESAKSLLDQAWPQGVSGKDAFWSEFLAKLHTSPYWPALAALQNP
jgi:hypothetical protein